MYYVEKYIETGDRMWLPKILLIKMTQGAPDLAFWLRVEGSDASLKLLSKIETGPTFHYTLNGRDGVYHAK